MSYNAEIIELMYEYALRKKGTIIKLYKKGLTPEQISHEVIWQSFLGSYCVPPSVIKEVLKKEIDKGKRKRK